MALREAGQQPEAGTFPHMITFSLTTRPHAMDNFIAELPDLLPFDMPPDAFVATVYPVSQESRVRVPSPEAEEAILAAWDEFGRSNTRVTISSPKITPLLPNVRDDYPYL